MSRYWYPMQCIYINKLYLIVLIYGSVSWTPIKKYLKKILNGNYTRMLRAILNRYWKDHPNNKEIYGNIPDICTSIIQQRLRFSGNCWRSKLELASDVIILQPIGFMSRNSILMKKKKRSTPQDIRRSAGG